MRRWRVEDMIQVAGVIDADEAELLVACGVTHLGFPFRLPVHREDLSERAAADIIAALPASVRGVLITYLDTAAEIASLAGELGVSWVQLHGSVEVTALERLRSAHPALTIIKSLIVRAGDAAGMDAEVARYEPWVDAFITDTFDPETGASGATGKVHDWDVDRRIVARSRRPVIAAGGLRPSNVGDVIRAVRPAGVDVHTGVEGPDGRKRRELVEAFVAEARRGFASIRT
ncbi:phosphoribosylanthranilate isomerase [Sorangium sp. So ce1036]|uniref:phosphoribosylanthranilate isomerase n=1 Tax=Sorangium sp. So ce1036 TaxID=3133328 RepID=UPI003F0508C3